MDRQRALDAALRTDFLSFLQKTFSTVTGGAPFQNNWHLEAIAYQLERIEQGDRHRLIVTMPPRALKSITISVAWVAWLLGHTPNLNVICVSYSHDLATKHASDCRAVMMSDWYLRLFPRTRLVRNAEADLRTTLGGGRFATSVGGTLTGRGGDLIIIDDPMKPDDAMSDTRREAVHGWFANTLTSRLNDKINGAIVLVMQRLHEDDLVRRLRLSEEWIELCLPAIGGAAETISLPDGRHHKRPAGEALHPEREPIHTLEAQRQVMGSAAFAAQYLQAPVPAEGNLIKREWLERYVDAPKPSTGDWIVQSWDTASSISENADYSVCITALLRNNQVYILDVFRKRLAFPDLLRAVKHQARRFKPKALLIEKAASGHQLIQALKEDQSDTVPIPIAIPALTDKLTRFDGQTARIEAGCLHLPREAPWLADFERELLSFPSTRHDDQVDALSQLLAWSRKRRPKALVGPVYEPHPNRFRVV